MPRKSSRPKKTKPKMFSVRTPRQAKGKTLKISDATRPAAAGHFGIISTTPVAGKPKSKP